MEPRRTRTRTAVPTLRCPKCRQLFSGPHAAAEVAAHLTAVHATTGSNHAALFQRGPTVADMRFLKAAGISRAGLEPQTGSTGE